MTRPEWTFIRSPYCSADDYWCLDFLHYTLYLQNRDHGYWDYWWWYEGASATLEASSLDEAQNLVLDAFADYLKIRKKELEKTEEELQAFRGLKK